MTKCPNCGYEAPVPPKPEYEYTGYLAPFLPTILPLLRSGYKPPEIRDMLFEAHGAKACSSQWGTDPTAMIAVIGRRYGITKPGPQNVEDRKRSRQIAERRANGETYRSIAASLNISPGRVRGIAIREERRAAEAEQQQE